ncbi:MAG: hypothetical protein IJX72_03430, partial [Clostridia bacterium]|nr:hypothetical protein [Clostridia bacterium]
MNKMIRKLFAAIMALILTVVMVATVSYAWFTLSDAPVVAGIQVTIGGGNTILIAPDQSEEVDGKTYHYPGRFNSTLIFSQHTQYDYLTGLAGLTPVSTADGEHWYIAEYYDYNDEKVINGEAVAGQIKPITEFPCDTDLTYANLTSEEAELARTGSYVFLDFWVVSPGADYTLRVSTDHQNGGSGSYLLELMTPVKNEDGTYSLVETAGNAAASARVGFLVCQDRVSDVTMAQYQASAAYDDSYKILKGMYQQPGEDTLYTSGYRFTVYEPNADLHPLGEQGAYCFTTPVGYEGGRAVYADMEKKLTVQLTNRWRKPDQTTGITLEEAFTAWQIGRQGEEDLTVDEVKQDFYNNYLQRQLLPYV